MVGVIYVYVDTVFGVKGNCFFSLFTWMFQHDCFDCFECLIYIYVFCIFVFAPVQHN